MRRRPRRDGLLGDIVERDETTTSGAEGTIDKHRGKAKEEAETDQIAEEGEVRGQDEPHRRGPGIVGMTVDVVPAC